MLHLGAATRGKPCLVERMGHAAFGFGGIRVGDPGGKALRIWVFLDSSRSKHKSACHVRRQSSVQASLVQTPGPKGRRRKGCDAWQAWSRAEKMFQSSDLELLQAGVDQSAKRKEKTVSRGSCILQEACDRSFLSSKPIMMSCGLLDPQVMAKAICGRIFDTMSEFLSGWCDVVVSQSFPA